MNPVYSQGIGAGELGGKPICALTKQKTPFERAPRDRRTIDALDFKKLREEDTIPSPQNLSLALRSRSGFRMIETLSSSPDYLSLFVSDSTALEYETKDFIKAPLHKRTALRTMVVAGFLLKSFLKIADSLEKNLIAEIHNILKTGVASLNELKEIVQEAENNIYYRKDYANSILRYLPHETVAEIKVEIDALCFLLRLDFGVVVPLKERPRACSAILRYEARNRDLSGQTELDLSETYIETMPKDILERLTGLKRINFSNNRASNVNSLLFLAMIPSLEEIDLSGNRFSSIPRIFFEKLPNLQKIILKNNQISEFDKHRLYTSHSNVEFVF